MYNKLSLTKPDLTKCVYDSDDIETLKYYLFKGFTVLQVNPDNDLENYVSDYYNINYDNAKYFDFLEKGNYDIIELIKLLLEGNNNE